jgi:hypothetical protein
MTSASEPEPPAEPAPTPRTVFDVLFGSHSAVDAVEQALDGPAGEHIRTAVGELPPRLHQPMNEHLAAAISELLQPRLDDILIDGWRRYDDLVAAALRTDVNGSSEEVDLIAHTVTYMARPSIELFVDGVKRGNLELVVKVELDVDELTAVVDAGRLTALRSGHAVIHTHLEVADVEMARTDLPVDLALMLVLGAGIPLLPGPTVSSPPST